ncbi:ABC transporter permease [Tundrisphaera lichenicola]|uniref:ABC transporter permease n=1 Tax=Tundrisphaera lichenicola TaxID=2029860 RepID=UPI003EB8370F
MNWLRGPVRVAGLGLLMVLALLPMTPWIASAIDRGPGGSARLSAFPIALALFDPFILECSLHSVIVALLVAAGSMILGGGLAHLSGPRSFWGRAPLAILARSPLASGPLLIAPGVFLLMGGPEGWEWLAARSILGWSAEDVARWSALVWVGLAWGSPIVASMVESAYPHIEPSWIESARAAGASPARAWRDVAWPILRPEAARGAGLVFTLALVEPAGPILLGLRRTLAVAILGAAHRLDQPTRAATLAVLGLLIAVAGRWLILRWGGPSYPRPGFGREVSPTPAGRLRSLASILLLGAWSAISAGPVLTLLWHLAGTTRAGLIGSWSGLLIGWLADPEIRGFATNAASAGLFAIALDLLILRAISFGDRGFLNSAARRLVDVFEVVPPLSLAVGAMALPWLLGVLADQSGESVGPRIRAIARELSPARWPGFLLIAALAAGRLPTLVRAADRAIDRSRPVLADAALLMGASKRRARRAGQNRWLGIVPARPMILSIALASTALAPALLLAPGTERRTLAPAVLMSLGESGQLSPEWLGPIAAILLINLVGFGLASGGRSGLLGGWFRG